MSKESNRFSLACQKAGIYHDCCGVAARDLLLELRGRPMVATQSPYGGLRMPRPGMGQAVKTGLARFDPPARCYVITPAGETWLKQLEQHGLLAEKQKDNTDAAQRVPTPEVMA